MHKSSLLLLTLGLSLSASAWSQTNSCDLTSDGRVDQADVKAAIDMSLNVTPCTAAIAGSGVCNVVVVQRVINASLGGACLTSAGIHSVVLNWVASTSAGVTGYKVYRATSSTGPYAAIGTVTTGTNYSDHTVQSGQTYFYVTTALSGTTESSFSNQAQAVIPVP